MDILVVGAGFSGAVFARQAAEAGHDVIVIDKRPHIGGNAYDCYDAHGVLIHPYGPHIFHTNSPRVFNFLSRFTKWRMYHHRAVARVGGANYPWPINRKTLDMLGIVSLPTGPADYRAVTSEDVVLEQVGPLLCDMFFRGYTRKQWGRDLFELDPSVVRRVPVRLDYEDRYFDDTYQFMPRPGYLELFGNLLTHPRIGVELDTPYEGADGFDHVVWTGPIDEFFDYVLGRLPYRSLHFRHDHFARPQHQCAGTVNYPELSVPFTRVTEFKHLTGQECAGTSICTEYPRDTGEPYYPVPCAESRALYERYATLARARPAVTFLGRLARYRYINMDQAVGAALATAQRMFG